MQTYLSMTIALFTIFIIYVLTMYVYPIMRMSAEKRAAELEADPNLFFNNFAFICLTCFECRACDNIAMHCATTHNNADFDLAWSSLRTNGHNSRRRRNRSTGQRIRVNARDDTGADRWDADGGHTTRHFYSRLAVRGRVGDNRRRKCQRGEPMDRTWTLNTWHVAPPPLPHTVTLVGEK